ncbi:MAG: hypothetical protein LUE86_09960, partial [Clostridiales bacterium]|nr:hypothetical protein [Clostridiales bacterium]
YKHIFSGYRGKDAFQSLSERRLWQGLWHYLDIIHLRVFGNLFLFLLFLGIILYIVKKVDSIAFHIDEKKRQYLQILIPTISYFVIVAKIAPYYTDRYVMNLMGLLYVFVFSALIQLAGNFSERSWIGILIAALLVLFCSYRDGIPYLYLSEQDNVAAIESHKDSSCLYLYDKPWKILPNYLEMVDLNEIVFIQAEHLNMLHEDNLFHGYDTLLIYIDSTIDANNTLERLLEDNPDLDKSEQLFSNGYATAYYLD